MTESNEEKITSNDNRQSGTLYLESLSLSSGPTSRLVHVGPHDVEKENVYVTIHNSSSDHEKFKTKLHTAYKLLLNPSSPSYSSPQSF